MNFQADSDDTPYVAYIGGQPHQTTAGALKHYLAAYGSLPFCVERKIIATAREVSK